MSILLESNFSRTVIGVFYILAAAFAIVGYSLYFVVISKRRKLRLKNKWLTALAVSDGLFIIHMIQTSLTIFSGTFDYESNSIINALCSLTGPLVSIHNMLGIFINRITKARAVAAGKEIFPESADSFTVYITLVWLLGIGISSLPAVGVGAYETTQSVNAHAAGLHFDPFNHNCHMFVFLFVIAMTYAASPITVVWKEMEDSSVKNLRTCKTMAKITLAFILIGYGPYGILVFTEFASHYTQYNLPWFVDKMFHLSPKVMVALHPYTYILSDDELQMECGKLLFSTALSTSRKKE